DICRRDAHDKGIALKLELGAAEHHVCADPARLQQIMWNLVKNAVKFTPSRGTIEVRSQTRDRSLVLEVVDSGIGIDASDITRIFEALAQPARPDSRRPGGLGLGLTISRTLAEAHGGRLEAASRGLGHGSKFTLTLPLAEARATVALPSPARADAIPSEM